MFSGGEAQITVTAGSQHAQQAEPVQLPPSPLEHPTSTPSLLLRNRYSMKSQLLFPRERRELRRPGREPRLLRWLLQPLQLWKSV